MTPEDLLAYVDGELDPASRDRVERELRQDPAGIASLAALYRQRMQLRADIWEMCYREGVAMILEPGRGDGGNVFVSAVTMPRKSDDAGEQGNRNSRGPRPWATESTAIIGFHGRHHFG